MFVTRNLVLLVLFTQLFVVIYTPAQQDIRPPEMPIILSIEQFDENDDGIMDTTILAANMITAEDQIIIFDSKNNMRVSDNWSDIVDFTDDTWLFDIAGDGTAELIIQFTQSAERTTAFLFSDTNGDRKVDYRISENVVSILESSYPTMTVQVDGNWYLPDGKLNWNLTFNMDGASLLPAYTSETTLSAYDEFFVLDGIPDIQHIFRDINIDGIPEYQLLRLVPDDLPRRGMRTIIFANIEEHQPLQPANFQFWPFLYDVSAEAYFDSRPISLNFFDTHPIVLVDWELAQLTRSDLYGYPIEEGFMVKTAEHFNLGEINPTDFETNMNWYDLANDDDGYPELHIRNRYYAA